MAPRGAGKCALRGRVCIGRKCRLAADTARDIFVGPRVGVGVSALGMRKITTTTTSYNYFAPKMNSLSEILLVQPEDRLLAVGQLLTRLLERSRDQRRTAEDYTHVLAPIDRGEGPEF